MAVLSSIQSFAGKVAGAINPKKKKKPQIMSSNTPPTPNQTAPNFGGGKFGGGAGASDQQTQQAPPIARAANFHPDGSVTHSIAGTTITLSPSEQIGFNSMLGGADSHEGRGGVITDNVKKLLQADKKATAQFLATQDLTNKATNLNAQKEVLSAEAQRQGLPPVEQGLPQSPQQVLSSGQAAPLTREQELQLSHDLLRKFVTGKATADERSQFLGRLGKGLAITAGVSAAVLTAGAATGAFASASEPIIMEASAAAATDTPAISAAKSLLQGSFLKSKFVKAAGVYFVGKSFTKIPTQLKDASSAASASMSAIDSTIKSVAAGEISLTEAEDLFAEAEQNINSLESSLHGINRFNPRVFLSEGKVIEQDIVRKKRDLIIKKQRLIEAAQQARLNTAAQNFGQ